MQIVQSTTMNHQIQCIETLTHDLQTSFHPVFFSGLEKLGRVERAKQIASLLGLWRLVMQLVHHPSLEELLIAHLHLER